MGNEGSKPSKGNSKFSRSDTMTSTRSAKSLRTRKSTKDFNSQDDNDNFNSTNKKNKEIPSNINIQTSNQSHSHDQSLELDTPKLTSHNSYSHTPSSHRPISSRRSSFKSNMSNDLANGKSEHYDYIYDDEFTHDHESPTHLNNNKNVGPELHKLPPSMAILKPKSPILRMNSSTSINDTSIQHMSAIERQHSNLENSNMSRRNSTTTVNSTNSKNSRNSKHSRNGRVIDNTDEDAKSSHGIPIDAFNNLMLNTSSPNYHMNDQTNNNMINTNSPSALTSVSRTRSHTRSRSSTFSNKVRTPSHLNDDSNTKSNNSDIDYINFKQNENPQPGLNNNEISASHNTDNTGPMHDLYEHNYDNSHSATKSSSSSIRSISHSRSHSRSHSIDQTNSIGHFGNGKDGYIKNNDVNSHNNIGNSNHINSAMDEIQESKQDINYNNGTNNNNFNSGETEMSNNETLNSHDFRRRYNLNIEDIIQKLLDAGYSGKRTKSVCLKNSEIALICSVAREIFLSQPTLLELSAPVKIVGDVHGQYIDLIRIFSKCGFPPASNYLFLGDYVDRGKQSLETILLLLCYKIKFPENFFLLRGNHECAQITRQYGFYDECKRRTNLKTWKLFVDTFNTLPIAAIVAGKIFCVHGGLSPVLNSMDEIRNIRRPTDVPDFGLLNDLLWSDPVDSPNEWEDNERGVSYCYNKVAINKFLNKFQFDLVVRAHMVVEDGYEFFNDRSLVTVFSAPNYCGEFDNWGAVMGVSEELLCSFELLDPLDSVALKNLMKKGRIERRNAMLNYSASPSK